jgi:hypothetical protein
MEKTTDNATTVHVNDARISDSHVRLMQRKIELADTATAKEEAALVYNRAMQAVAAEQNALVEAIKAAAKENGIEFDDPASGRWNFDLINMTFTKLS